MREKYLLDRLEIEDLFARYAHAADEYNAKAWLDCFAVDGIFEFAVANQHIQFIGQAALHEFIDAHIRLLPGTRHAMTNHLVEIEGAKAQHRCTITGTLSRPEKVYTFISGGYESHLEKVDGEWKILKRTAHADNVASITDGELAVLLQPLMAWMVQNGTIA
jgi:3-phenylpropionate/cinnamic acid dioxygenase small subunit